MTTDTTSKSLPAKLRLQRHTLRILTTAELRQVAGGTTKGPPRTA